MTDLEALLQASDQPGAAALVARREAVEVAGFGEVEPDSICRIGSTTKPITAAAVMLLVDDGRVALGDPIARWLPELASPDVARTPESPAGDLVPAARLITASRERRGSMMSTDHLTREQCEASTLFLEGAGWGLGGSVAPDGRYGWVGGTGTTAHVRRRTGTVAVLHTQVQMPGPTSTPIMRRFREYAFGEPA
jgi:CubicO group peptidase (beta-lactamase class C family)